MELECTFDIQRDIVPYILGRREEAMSKGQTDKDLTVCVVGQERNGTLLYTWDDVAPVDGSYAQVTHIGLYDPAEQKNKCLFVHDCKILITSCSMNHDHSILAYVVKETQPVSPPGGQDEGATSLPSITSHQPQDVHRAFLAEIKPQHAIFDLNVERSSLLHVQFLWPRTVQGPADPMAATVKDCRLLVFLHRESIGLYRVPIARMGNDSVVISGPPDAQPVVNRFLWAQWDAPTQRLFVVLQRNRLPSEPEQLAIFRCYEFTGQGSQTSFTKMMEIELPPDVKLPSSRYSYELPSLRNTVSDKSINMYVICQSGGSLCVCYQLPHKKLTGSKPSSRRHSKAKLQIPPTAVSGSGPEGQVQRRPGSLDLSQPDPLRDDPAGPQSNTPGSLISSSSVPSLARLTAPESPLTDSNLDLSYDSTSNISAANWSTLGSPCSDSAPSPLNGSRTLLDAHLNKNLHESGIRDKSKSPSQFVDVHYVVLVLHHKTILHCSVPHLQKSIAKRMQLFFAPMNGYIMVYYPGTVLHLLNVNSEMEPCLHLAFEPQDVPWIPLPGDDSEQSRSEQLRSTRPLLMHCQRDRTVSKYDDILFDGMSGCCYQPIINKDKLPLLLMGDSQVPFKLGLLHLALINLKDATLNKKIIESITQDAFQLEMQDILAEFLLAGTFCCVRLKLDKDILRYLPFTKVDTTKTVFIETLDGSRLACIKAVENRYIPKIFLGKKGRRDKRLGVDASSYLWDTLERQIRRSQDSIRAPSKRFDTRKLTQKLREQEQSVNILRSEEKTTLPSHPQNARSSLLKKVAAFSKRALTPTKEVKQVKAKDPLAAAMMEENSTKETGEDGNHNKHIEMILEEVVSFFRSRMPFHNQDRLENYASEFVSSQLQHFKVMVAMLLSANGFHENIDDLAQVPLCDGPTEDEMNLFHMVERVFAAAQNLCFPMPIGFKNFILCLAYRCLDAGMFLQYVNQGVFDISETFMTRMVKEVSDEEKTNVDLKMKLVQKLPKASADRVLMSWNHPSSNLIIAQQYATSCLHEGGEYGQRNLSSAMLPQTRSQKSRKKSMEAAIPGLEAEEDFLDMIPNFPPLNYFMKYIEGTDKNWQSPTQSRLDIGQKANRAQFVGRVALQASVRSHGLDLGGIAF
ncbi:protein pigeon-like [Lytechinus pictus]|uniref:protein pigeon-like n=1 Tax=Lytechinus pictus TaxID=7653 RepID=UPI0030BA249C